ncbi:Teichoic acid translocation permease protein TagG [Lacunisphaera limnophila]|uniref:Transport permease protein n=1 Tax=Lacunisphaera limnophila TaxID=1838286 RepID=A0A1D8AY12_9BACT|nr:ABC transporter permease [Lacunisphaera limnophila]AOS45754.1 Teichoic acid translocation permease protein TagG [Lacunisphaera limnophila]
MASAEIPVLLLEAGRTSRTYWQDLWRFRELLGFLAWRDLKVRYKQAVLGIAWAVIQPVTQTALLTFIFSKLAKMPDAGLPYFALVLTGNLSWQLFSTAFTGAGNSLVGNSHLISKVYFPRLLVPLSALAVALADFSIMLGLTIPLLCFFGLYPGWQLLVLPLFIILTLIIAVGAGLWITALTVKFRDFRFITPFLVQIGMFATPIGYLSDSVPNWRDLLALNPISGVVDGFRWCLLGGRTAIYLPGLGVSVCIGLLLLVTGVWYFRRTEREFADVI